MLFSSSSTVTLKKHLVHATLLWLPQQEHRRRRHIVNLLTSWANNMKNRFSQVITTSRKHILHLTILQSKNNSVQPIKECWYKHISRINIEIGKAIQLSINACNPIVGQVHQIWEVVYSEMHITIKCNSTITIMLNWLYWMTNLIFTNEPGRESLATLFIYVWIYMGSILCLPRKKSLTAQNS